MPSSETPACLYWAVGRQDCVNLQFTNCSMRFVWKTQVRAAGRGMTAANDAKYVTSAPRLDRGRALLKLCPREGSAAKAVQTKMAGN